MTTEETINVTNSVPWLRIPVGLLPVIGLLIAQTGAGIWWASGVGRDVDNIRSSVHALRTESYTRVEAQLMVQRLDQVDSTLSEKHNLLVARVEQIAETQRRTEAIVMMNQQQQQQHYPRAESRR